MRALLLRGKERDAQVSGRRHVICVCNQLTAAQLQYIVVAGAIAGAWACCVHAPAATDVN